MQIIPKKMRSKFEMLEERQSINGEPDSLLDLDWSEYWSEPSNIKPPAPKRSKKAKKAKS